MRSSFPPSGAIVRHAPSLRDALPILRAATKAGKVRFIGFTGHKDPLVHLRMLEVAAEHGFRFDAVQMPLNRSEEHTLNSSHRCTSYAVFCLKKKTRPYRKARATEEAI